MLRQDSRGQHDDVPSFFRLGDSGKKRKTPSLAHPASILGFVFFAGITRKKKKWVPLESHYRLEVLPQNLNEITKIRCVWRDPNNRRFQRGILLNQAIISQGFLLIFDRCIPFPWCWFFLQNTKLPHVMGHTKPADLQFFNSVVLSWQTKTTLR